MFNVALSTGQCQRQLSTLFRHSAESKEISTSVSTKLTKNEMSGACSSDGGEERLIQGSGGET
jgi:hypothetical protein